MRIAHARKNKTTVQVNFLGIVYAKPHDLSFRTNFDDLPRSNGEGFGKAASLIHNGDFAIVVHLLCILHISALHIMNLVIENCQV